MGSIYKVHHDLLDEVRVIKVMRPHAANDEELQRRFAREAKLVTRLKHPNIAAIHDFALDDDGTAYIVMEFIDGLNLTELIRLKGKMDPASALEIARQSLRALDYLHRKQIVHRDISPENVMVTQGSGDGIHVKLIDLGIAKALDEQVAETRTGVFMGKFRYSSPEQLTAGAQIDGRSDLYSLGIVLYTLLTGKSPILGDSIPQIIYAQIHTPPRPFAETDPKGDVPEDVRGLILKAMEKDREKRYQSAADFVAAVEELQRRYPPPMLSEETKITASRKLFVAPAPLTSAEQAEIDRHFRAVPTPLPSETTAEQPVPTVDGRNGAVPTIAAPSPRSKTPLLISITLGAILLAAALGALFVRSDGAGASEPRKQPPPVSTASSTGSTGPIIAPEDTPPVVNEPTPEVKEPVIVTDSAANTEQEALRAALATARSGARAAKNAADADNARTFATALYGQAISRQRDAERLAAGNPSSARLAFLEAASLFQTARDLARNESARLTDAQRREEAARQAELEKRAAAEREAADRRAAEERARELERQRAEADRKKAQPSETVTPAQPADEDQVRAVLTRFVAAQESLDAASYRRVYPAANPARVAEAFSSLRSQRLELTINSVRVTGSRAEVSAFERRTAVPKVGSEQRVSGARTFTLEKRDGQWVITGLR